MNWLVRYIDAVKAQLPPKTADDVAAEIRSLLEDEIEAREAERGRPLDEAELLELIRGKGHPMQVAARYHERRTLVDEDLFPLYKTSLQYLLLGLLLLHLLQASSAVLSGNAWNPLHVLIGLWWDFGHAALLGFATLTLAFFLFQAPLRRHAGLSDWQPRNLPQVRSETQAIGRGSSVFEFIFDLFLLRVLNMGMFAPQSSFAIIGWSEQALPWVRMLSLLIALSLLLTVVNLFQPWWTVRKRVFCAALSFFSALVLGYLYQLDVLFVTQAAADGAEFAAKVGRNAVAWIALFLLCDAVYSVWQALRGRAATKAAPRTTAAGTGRI